MSQPSTQERNSVPRTQALCQVVADRLTAVVLSTLSDPQTKPFITTDCASLTIHVAIRLMLVASGLCNPEFRPRPVEDCEPGDEMNELSWRTFVEDQVREFIHSNEQFAVNCNLPNVSMPNQINRALICALLYFEELSPDRDAGPTLIIMYLTLIEIWIMTWAQHGTVPPHIQAMVNQYVQGFTGIIFMHRGVPLQNPDRLFIICDDVNNPAGPYLPQKIPWLMSGPNMNPTWWPEEPQGEGGD